MGAHGVSKRRGEWEVGEPGLRRGAAARFALGMARLEGHATTPTQLCQPGLAHFAEPLQPRCRDGRGAVPAHRPATVR
jgi:hypothetical protein